MPAKRRGRLQLDRGLGLAGGDGCLPHPPAVHGAHVEDIGQIGARPVDVEGARVVRGHGEDDALVGAQHHHEGPRRGRSARLEHHAGQTRLRIGSVVHHHVARDRLSGLDRGEDRIRGTSRHHASARRAGRDPIRSGRHRGSVGPVRVDGHRAEVGHRESAAGRRDLDHGGAVENGCARLGRHFAGEESFLGEREIEPRDAALRNVGDLPGSKRGAVPQRGDHEAARREPSQLICAGGIGARLSERIAELRAGADHGADHRLAGEVVDDARKRPVGLERDLQRKALPFLEHEASALLGGEPVGGDVRVVLARREPADEEAARSIGDGSAQVSPGARRREIDARSGDGQRGGPRHYRAGERCARAELDFHSPCGLARGDADRIARLARLVLRARREEMRARLDLQGEGPRIGRLAVDDARASRGDDLRSGRGLAFGVDDRSLDEARRGQFQDQVLAYGNDDRRRDGTGRPGRLGFHPVSSRLEALDAEAAVLIARRRGALLDRSDLVDGRGGPGADAEGSPPPGLTPARGSRHVHHGDLGQRDRLAPPFGHGPSRQGDALRKIQLDARDRVARGPDEFLARGSEAVRPRRHEVRSGAGGDPDQAVASRLGHARHPPGLLAHSRRHAEPRVESHFGECDRLVVRRRSRLDEAVLRSGRILQGRRVVGQRGVVAGGVDRRSCLRSGARTSAARGCVRARSGGDLRGTVLRRRTGPQQADLFAAKSPERDQHHRDRDRRDRLPHAGPSSERLTVSWRRCANVSGRFR